MKRKKECIQVYIYQVFRSHVDPLYNFRTFPFENSQE